MSREKIEIAVIGAGLSGLSAACSQKRQGKKVVIFEKARGVGGRLSTRRFADSIFDHGVQSFVSFDESPFPFLRDVIKKTEHESYSLPAMNALPKEIAKHEKLDVRLRTRIVKLSCESMSLLLEDESGQIYECEKLILSCPVPQSLELLKSNNIEVSKIEIEKLSQIEYSRCLTVMFAFEGSAPLLQEMFLKNVNNEVSCITDNMLKGISTKQSSISLQYAPEFSLLNWDLDQDSIFEDALNRIRVFADVPKVLSSQLHRWRYSQVEKSSELSPLVLESYPNIVLCGDAFSGKHNVEGALISGNQVAEI